MSTNAEVASRSEPSGSGMRAGYSTLSAEPSFKVLADSAPYCLFRNKENYLISASGNQQASSFAENNRAENQVRLYNDCLADAHIPSYLLYGTLRRDAAAQKSNKRDQSWSTVAALRHNHRSLFVHVSGRYLDQVVLRDAAHSYTGLDLRNPPGFTLSLGNGSPVQEIVHAGSTHWGSSSLLLARTRAEVFQLRTVSLDDVQTRQGGHAGVGSGATEANVLTTVLDPVQKWQLPHEICSTSTSPGSWSTACFLTACGRVCTWSPSAGVQLAGAGACVLPAEALSAGLRDYSMRIDCTLHPQVSHIACDKAVYLFDLRCASTVAAQLCATPDRRVLSTKQHGGAAQCFLVSTRDSVSLIDTRYTKTPLAQQYIPAGHEKMKYFANPLRSQAGLFLGSSRGSPQLLAHSFEQGSADSSTSHGSDAHEAAQRLLSASRACGSEEAVRWDVDGFPVVDAGRAEESGLLGFDLVPLTNNCASLSEVPTSSEDWNQRDGSGDDSDRGSSSDSSEDSEDSDPRARFERRRRAARKATKVPSQSSSHGQQSASSSSSSSSSRSAPMHSALLLQQSHRGDVFAQRVSWSVNPYRIARLGLSAPASTVSGGSVAGRLLSMGGASSVAASVLNRKAPTRKAKRKRPLHYRGGGSDDESEEEGSSGSEGEGGERDIEKEGGQQGAQHNLQIQQQQQEQHVALQWSGLPPVQTQLPCGVRCHPSAQGHLPPDSARPTTIASASASASADAAASRTKRDSALKATKRHLKTIIRNNGLVLQNAISVRDSNPSGEHKATHIYPSPSSAFLDFVPEDALHGFDVIKMYPEDLRVDLPTLPTHGALVMQQTSAAVNARSAVDYVTQHYKEAVLAYLEKESKTLWEIWKFLLVKTGGKRLELNHLRQSLRTNYGLIETRVATCGPRTTEFGIAKVKKVRSSDNGSDSDASQASSNLDGSPYMSSSSFQPVRPQTFDGLCVREVHLDRSRRDMYRDASKGREVRMRRRPAPAEDTPISEWSCSCAAHSAQCTDLAKLTLCGEKSCVLPHTLVFRIDKSPTAEGGSSGAGAALRGGGGRAAGSVKQKAEAFYWGSSLVPRTVPTASLPPPPSLASQSQSQPMSQLRFQLSQMSQNSQTPFSQQQPSQSFTPAAPRVPATPGTRAAPAAPEPSLDVTDSILAVLSNNWNRSLDHTAFVDPARTSLLQAWAPR